MANLATTFQTMAVLTGIGLAAHVVNADEPKVVLREGDLISRQPGSLDPPDSLVTNIQAVRANGRAGYVALIGSVEELMGLTQLRPYVMPAFTQPTITPCFWGTESGGNPKVLSNPLSHAAAIVTQVPAQIEENFAFGPRGELAFSLLCATATCQDDTVKSGFVDSLWWGNGTNVIAPFAVAPESAEDIAENALWRGLSHPRISPSEDKVYALYSINTQVSGQPIETGLALYAPTGATPLLWSGRTVASLSASLANTDPIIDYGISTSSPARVIAAVRLEHSTAAPAVDASNDQAVLLNGVAISSGGIVRKGSALGATGANPGELWNSFRGVAVSGGVSVPRAWAIWGTTRTGSATKNIIVRSNQVLLREGQVIGGKAITGPVTQFAMNDSGDVLSAWLWDGSPALFLNDTAILSVPHTSPIDLGDGLSGEITGFRGQRTADLSARTADGSRTVVTVFTVAGMRIDSGSDEVRMSPGKYDRRYDALLTIDVEQLGVVSCPADFNGSGMSTADDIFAFLDAWFDQNGDSGPSLSADFNGDLTVSADDIFAFLDAWFAGCA